MLVCLFFFFFFSSRRRHTRLQGDWSSDVCSSDLVARPGEFRDRSDVAQQPVGSRTIAKPRGCRDQSGIAVGCPSDAGRRVPIAAKLRFTPELHVGRTVEFGIPRNSGLTAWRLGPRLRVGERLAEEYGEADR